MHAFADLITTLVTTFLQQRWLHMLVWKQNGLLIRDSSWWSARKSTTQKQMRASECYRCWLSTMEDNARQNNYKSIIMVVKSKYAMQITFYNSHAVFQFNLASKSPWAKLKKPRCACLLIISLHARALTEFKIVGRFDTPPHNEQSTSSVLPKTRGKRFCTRLNNHTTKESPSGLWTPESPRGR